MNNQRVIDGLQSTDYSFIVGDDQWVINEESKPNNFVASQLLIDVNDHSLITLIILKCHYDQIFTSWLFRWITKNSLKEWKCHLLFVNICISSRDI